MQQAFASYLINAAWQIPVVAICALIVARFAGLSPRARNGLWLSFLAVAAVLPAVSLDTLLPHALPTVARVAPETPVLMTSAAATQVLTTAEPAMRLAPWSVGTMTALFALVAAALIVRLVAAAAAARRLVRESEAAVLPAEATQALNRLAKSHGRAVPTVRRSDRLYSPAVVGVLRPVILIPSDMTADGDDLRAALLHEMAHVLRHDYAINLACEVLTLPVCWHPALLGIKAGVRHSRELACDAIAASAMASQKTYAKCLVSLAQSLGAQTPRVPGSSANAALAVGLFGRNDLEERLMQLMKPKDAEGPMVRTARLCGLAAVGASLLGSAALLHVTPVFAQVTPAPAPPPVTAAPLAPAAPPSAAGSLADQAQRDAAKPATAHHHGGVIYSQKGVIFEVGQTGYRHSFTASNGEAITVVNDDPKAPSAEQQRLWEADARDAEAKAAAAEAMVNSPEFKARIEKAKAAGEAARKMVESPEFKARIAKAEADGRAAEAMVNSPEFKARIASANAAGEAARKMVESPEFKAKIAKAEADGRAAEAMVNSPEFKAKIAKARADGEAARAMVDSPEFQARMAKLRDLGAQIQREFDEPRAHDQAPASPTP